MFLAAVACLWSYRLGWERAYLESNVAFNRRLEDVTRSMFEHGLSADEAGDEDTQASADE